MKKLNLLMAGIAAFGFLTACSDDDSSSTNGNPTEVVNTVKQGTWRVTSYMEDANDETNHFTGYNFTFPAFGSRCHNHILLRENSVQHNRFL